MHGYQQMSWGGPSGEAKPKPKPNPKPLPLSLPLRSPPTIAFAIAPALAAQTIVLHLRPDHAVHIVYVVHIPQGARLLQPPSILKILVFFVINFNSLIRRNFFS